MISKLPVGRPRLAQGQHKVYLRVSISPEAKAAASYLSGLASKICDAALIKEYKRLTKNQLASVD
jgi:hypothetical protein